MAAEPFVAPDFLQNQTEEEIHARMLAALPADIDTTEGGFAWDFTRPTAMEKGELMQVQFPETLQIMFPMWADGAWLDYHAGARVLPRKAASAASGDITLAGIAGTMIPAGTLFAVPASGDDPAIEFFTLQQAAIDAQGGAKVAVSAVIAGTAGNVDAHTVSIMVSPIKGITGIDNPSPMTGGTEEEGDESLRARIDQADKNSGMSFVGNNADYVRWAREVSAVGAVVVMPTWNGPGTVKLVLVDENGQPANEMILQAVYDHIMGVSEDDLNRLAPIGATLTVAAPEALTVDYSALLLLEEDVDMEAVREAFAAALMEYYEEAVAEGVLRYNRVASLLIEVPGVLDYSALRMGGQVENISISKDAYPVTGSIALTEGGG